MTVFVSLAILVTGILVTAALIFAVGRFVPRDLLGSEDRRGLVFEFCGVLSGRFSYWFLFAGWYLRVLGFDGST